MNRFWIVLSLSVALLWSACTPPAPPPDPPQQPPTPKPTPHAALGAMEAAIKLYPDMAKPDSHFARTFAEVKEDTMNKSPQALSAVDWPLMVARRTAVILGVQPAMATPVPETTPLPPPPKVPGSLERGAYDKRGSARMHLTRPSSPMTQ